MAEEPETPVEEPVDDEPHASDEISEAVAAIMAQRRGKLRA